MATFDVSGFKEVEEMILAQSEAAEKFAPDMLKAGAEVLADAWRREIQSMPGSRRSIGTLARSIKWSSVKASITGRYIVIQPKGNQPHGSPGRGRGRVKEFKTARSMAAGLARRKTFDPKEAVSNAQVGFTLEYGSSTMPGRRWMASANSKASGEVHEAMRKVWEEKQNG